VPAHELTAGIGVLALFVRGAGLVERRGAPADLRRGLRSNDVAVSSETAVINDSDIIGGVIKLSLGRKKHGLVRPQ
jgi:tyrosyl-tRNA synthetase